MRENGRTKQQNRPEGRPWNRDRAARTAAVVAALSGIALHAALYAPVALAQTGTAASGGAASGSGLKQMLLMTGIVLFAGSVGMFAALMSRLNRDRAAWEARRAEYLAWEQRRTEEEIIRAANAPATTAAPAGDRKGGPPSPREAETLLNRADSPATREVATVPVAAPSPAVTPATVAMDTAPLPPAGFGAELAVVGGPDQGRRFTITKPVLTLGREDRDILFSDDSISRRHAVLRVQTGADEGASVLSADKRNGPVLQFVLYDEESLHGTRVNGEVVGRQGRALKNGDRISLGKGRTVLLFERLTDGIEDSGA